MRAATCRGRPPPGADQRPDVVFTGVHHADAGQITVDSLAAIGNETGRFLLAASTSVQEALDSYDDRNGVFA